VGLIEEIYLTFNCLIDESMVREVVKGGRCDTLRWLYAKLVAPDDSMARRTDPSSHPSTRLSRCCSSSRDLLCVAAKRDDLEMIKTLLELMRGHFETIGNMQVCRGMTLQAAGIAARHGHVRIIEHFVCASTFRARRRLMKKRTLGCWQLAREPSALTSRAVIVPSWTSTRAARCSA
jgi:hypothetical protein